MVVFALAFARAMRDVIANAAIIGAILIALTGIGIFLGGVFTAGPETEILHFLLGFVVAFGSAIATNAFVGWRLRRADGWDGMARYSLFTAAGAVLLVAFFLRRPQSRVAARGGRHRGLIERALAIEVFAWHVVLGWRLFRKPTG